MVLVTLDNLEYHLNNIRFERENWSKEHPEEVNLVKTIKASQDN